MTNQPSTAVTLQRFVQHREAILRYWARARDDAGGGFYSWIGPAGDVWHRDHRPLLIQARLLYNYAEGMRAGLDFAAGHAGFLYDFLTTRLRTLGGWYSSWHDGKLRNPEVLDAYDNLFVVIGMARYAQASGRADVLDEAWRVFQLVEQQTVPADLAHCGVVGVMGASFRWGAPEAGCIGNLDLHYLEALVCLRDAGLAVDLTPRVAGMRTFFLAKILEPKLFLTFDRFDGSYDRPVRSPGSNVSLGHGLEWIDFFRCFEALALDKAVELGILGVAVRQGVRRNGAFEDSFYLSDGRCAGGAEFWPTVESIKTMNLAYTVYGAPYDEVCRRLAGFYFRYFVDSDGAVFTEVDRNGVATNRTKGGFWKCDYHTMRMCMDIIERPGGVFHQRARCVSARRRTPAGRARAKSTVKRTARGRAK
jgi:mannose/cellobiose epimerase-like protein (N-acyl-D-glucosamine 2-epimerase family)